MPQELYNLAGLKLLARHDYVYIGRSIGDAEYSLVLAQDGIELATLTEAEPRFELSAILLDFQVLTRLQYEVSALQSGLQLPLAKGIFFVEPSLVP